ncbi:MAG: SDR family oxidoreductase [Xanthomonadales bacterium]|nr:SDR family oxidoreductase [Xanthomonadales bacterium]
MSPNSSAIKLVYGASGYVGTHLVEHLRGSHQHLRAAARRLDALEARNWDEVECVRSDALNPETLPAALSDVDTAYYLVHSMAAGSDFGRLDLTAAANFARAAADAGVRRIVYLGGLVPDDARSEHIVSRRDTGEVLREGSVPVTEVRAGIIVGPGSAAFEVMRDLVFHLPIMLTPRWVRSKSPPIALTNLLTYLEEIAAHPIAAGRIYEAAGPDRLTYEEMMTILAEVANHRRPFIVPVPVLTPRLSAWWLKFVTSVPTNIARALVEGLEHDFEARTDPLETLIPQDLLNFEQSVEAVFEAEQQATVQARWVEGAFAFRGHRKDHAYYAKKASGYFETELPAETVWRELCTIGGSTRYFYLNFLWTLRELLDWFVGGSGLKRTRRHPEKLRVGDRVDSWDVVGLEPGKRLTMKFGMKAPGTGVLEFELNEGTDGRTRLTATAYWHPAGIAGILYWLSLEPAHRIIFRGLTRRICERAAERAQRLQEAP